MQSKSARLDRLVESSGMADLALRKFQRTRFESAFGPAAAKLDERDRIRTYILVTALPSSEGVFVDLSVKPASCRSRSDGLLHRCFTAESAPYSTFRFWVFESDPFPPFIWVDVAHPCRVSLHNLCAVRGHLRMLMSDRLRKFCFNIRVLLRCGHSGRLVSPHGYDPRSIRDNPVRPARYQIGPCPTAGSRRNTRSRLAADYAQRPRRQRHVRSRELPHHPRPSVTAVVQSQPQEAPLRRAKSAQAYRQGVGSLSCSIKHPTAAIETACKHTRCTDRGLPELPVVHSGWTVIISAP